MKVVLLNPAVLCVEQQRVPAGCVYDGRHGSPESDRDSTEDVAVLVAVLPSLSADELAGRLRGTPGIRLVGLPEVLGSAALEGPPAGACTLSPLAHAAPEETSGDPEQFVRELLHASFRNTAGSVPTEHAAVPACGLRVVDCQCLVVGPAGQTELTPTEFRLLQRIADDGPVSAEALAEHELQRRDCKGRGRDVVYRHLSNIRKKLLDVGAPAALERTLNGYRLRVAAERQLNLPARGAGQGESRAATQDAVETGADA